MQTHETEEYVSPSEQYNPYASVEILEPPATQEIPEQETSQPPHNAPKPPEPPEPLATPPAPPKRPHHGRNVMLIILLLASMAGGGLFIGWQFSGKGSPGTTATATPSQSSATVVQSQREAAIAKVAAAVVELKVTTAEGQQIGSGVIIDANGNIVTNNHVVSGAQTIEVVLSNGKTEQAQLIGTNASTDLAVVRIQPFDGMTVAKIGDSSKLVVGQTVLAIGS
ncbi:MAG: trypsin-like peptidase domain-containing protein, partial [Ktedonobacteraceae bacterium]|nr:trypsin-like peptidase domain-containing protein [Ktedonobacteraceae bacterium]